MSKDPVSVGCNLSFDVIFSGMRECRYWLLEETTCDGAIDVITGAGYAVPSRTSIAGTPTCCHRLRW
ncbi:MAG: hypothetical protein K0U34_08410, partial [Alphaproteobacteria bacterium]|nr:hypothetical protein [Alphaproteobacteria bacterium]